MRKDDAIGREPIQVGCLHGLAPQGMNAAEPVIVGVYQEHVWTT